MEEALHVLYRAYEKDANLLDIDWKRESKTQLANGYCDYDELEKEELKKIERGEGSQELRESFLDMKNHYFSALMCRYSYMAVYMFERRSSMSKRIDIEEFYDWVAESLLIGLKYRRWRSNEPQFEKIASNPNGAEVVFNQCFTSTCQRYNKHFNQDCRKVGYSSFSLDSTTNSNDKSLNKGEFNEVLNIEDTSFEGSDICKNMVQYYLKKGKVLEAFIIDGIGCQDSFVTRKEKNEQGDIVKKEYFNVAKLVRYLKALDITSLDYYKDTYHIEENVVVNEINKINNLSSLKLSSIVKSTLNTINHNKEIKEILW